MASADYLAKYLSAEDAEQQLGVKKKKRRKKKKAGAAAGAAAVKGSSVVIHDENPEWAKAVDAENSDAEDGPLVVELEDATTERPRQREGAGGWSTVDRERRDRSSSSGFLLVGRPPCVTTKHLPVLGRGGGKKNGRK